MYLFVVQRAIFKLILTLFIFLSLIVSSCATYQPPIKITIINNSGVPLIYKTVYIDVSFTDIQKNLIISAINEWQCSTKGMVKFEIGSNPNEYYYIKEPLFIENTMSFDPRIYSQEIIRTDGNLINALYTSTDDGVPLILVASDRIKDNNKFYQVIMHEFGHSIVSANHIKDEKSIMNAVNRKEKTLMTLTSEDFKYFCEKYKCDYKQLKSCKK